LVTILTNLGTLKSSQA